MVWYGDWNGAGGELRPELAVVKYAAGDCGYGVVDTCRCELVTGLVGMSCNSSCRDAVVEAG